MPAYQISGRTARKLLEDAIDKQGKAIDQHAAQLNLHRDALLSLGALASASFLGRLRWLILGK